MKIESLNTFKANTFKYNPNEALENENLKGLLLNLYIKSNQNNQTNSWDNIQYSVNSASGDKFEIKEDEKKELFDTKNALKPLLILTGVSLASILGISLALMNYSKTMAKTQGLVRPTDIPRSMNILQEQHLAMYRALRDPNSKNILGLIGVALMSAITLCSKNFVDGVKEVWIRKQEFDIEGDLQRNLIEVEKNSFKGKLDVVNNLYQNTSIYFKNVFDKNHNSINFKGKKEDNNSKKDNKNLLIGSIIGIGGFLALSFGLFKNYQKTLKNLDTFYQKTTDSKIRLDIEEAKNALDKNEAIEKLTNIFKTTNAKKENMEEIFKNIGLDNDKTNEIINSIEKDRIYATPPEALAGVSEKIQYYCYIDEERGHLYNWILNPENKFNKYLFLSFCLVSSVGYLAKSAVDAIKKVAVSRQNSKNELELRKKMVNVEIENFKAKKEAAINPLLDNFKNNLYKENEAEKLKEQAENILLEIKNGPPYVYF